MTVSEQTQRTYRLLHAVRGTRAPDGQVYVSLTDGTVVSGRLFGVSPHHVWVGSRHRVRRIPTHELALS